MKKPNTIGIIGGTGRMGQWFKAFFEKKGYEVLISSRRTQLSNKNLAQKSDVVIISVPIRTTIEIIEEIGPYVRPDALLMDFTSLKKAPVEAMLEYSNSEVVGAHPLFGPGINSLKGHTIIFCPARGENWLSWLKEVFKQAHLEITTPEKHDEIMAVIQALTHFLLLAFGLTITEMPFSVETLMRYSTTNFQVVWERVLNLNKQNPDIYASIQFDNSFYHEKVLPLCWQSLERLKEVVQKKNYDSFIRLFAEIPELSSK
jgi:prephenate dehydrogenase